MNARILILISVFTFAATSHAGTWTCNTGLKGHEIYKVIMFGDESGSMSPTARVSIMGLMEGPMPLQQLRPETGEFSRVMIGANDPRSKSVLWIMKDEIAPGTHRAYSLLSNFAIKQPLEGQCVFSATLAD